MLWESEDKRKVLIGSIGFCSALSAAMMTKTIHSHKIFNRFFDCETNNEEGHFDVGVNRHPFPSLSFYPVLSLKCPWPQLLSPATNILRYWTCFMSMATEIGISCYDFVGGSSGTVPMWVTEWSWVLIPLEASLILPVSSILNVKSLEFIISHRSNQSSNLSFRAEANWVLAVTIQFYHSILPISNFDLLSKGPVSAFKSSWNTSDFHHL